jgi:hypothetical protein
MGEFPAVRGAATRAGAAWLSFLAAYQRSTAVRWATLASVMIVAWLIFFWLVNLHSNPSLPVPSGAIPSNEV